MAQRLSSFGSGAGRSDGAELLGVRNHLTRAHPLRQTHHQLRLLPDLEHTTLRTHLYHTIGKRRVGRQAIEHTVIGKGTILTDLARFSRPPFPREAQRQRLQAFFSPAVERRSGSRPYFRAVLRSNTNLRSSVAARKRDFCGGRTFHTAPVVYTRSELV